MITCKIGTHGRLGNQMFQYAALLGIASKQNCEYGINYDIGDSKTWREFGVDNRKDILSLNKCFNLSAKHTTHSYPEITEGNQNFHFQDRFFNTGDNVNLHGYFQTNKYFDHVNDQVKKEFTFHDDIISEAKSFVDPKKDQETVSIHVRRGDYLDFPWHGGICTTDYYNKALTTYFSDKPYNFIVLTDDINWAKSTFAGSDNFFISESKNQYVDLCIMTLCDHYILANSSYSWWGYWLSTSSSKKTVAPSRWFKEQLKNMDTKDLYQPDWLLL